VHRNLLRGLCFCRSTGQPVGAEYLQLAQHVSIGLVSYSTRLSKRKFWDWLRRSIERAVFTVG